MVLECYLLNFFRVIVTALSLVKIFVQFEKAQVFFIVCKLVKYRDQ